MKELEGVKKFIFSNESEEVKRIDFYPLFKKLFKDKFKLETNADKADGYVEGKFIIEFKTEKKQWLEGFFQALHYDTIYGLTFSKVIVATHQILAVWSIDKFSNLSNEVKRIIQNSDKKIPPNKIGKTNASLAKDYSKNIREGAILFIEAESDNLFLESELNQFLDILQNIDSNRIQINPQNFIRHIEALKKFYDKPIDAVHCFYSIVNYWDDGSRIAKDDDPDGNDLQIISKYDSISPEIEVAPRDKSAFKKYVENHYVYTNEASGITSDYYFSRFDEVLYQIDPVFANQHGIYFTDLNLSKFAHWFTEKHLGKKLSDNYIVIDPAGGSGNLVTSWRGNIKHKIVSELQPDLLKTIKKRFDISIEKDKKLASIDYTIVPKPKDGEFLNFLDKSADDYYDIIENAVKKDGFKIDKPLAFVVNPPYKSQDQNEEYLSKSDANYEIHESIQEITSGTSDRYSSFLAQMLNISKKLFNEKKSETLVVVFSSTAWLFPRTEYKGLRNHWDNNFKFINGFFIDAKEFFDLNSLFPISLTIWKFNGKENTNKVELFDFSDLTKAKLIELFLLNNKTVINKEFTSILRKSKKQEFKLNTRLFRNDLNFVRDKDGNQKTQPRYNMYRQRKTNEDNKQEVFSGFPKGCDKHQLVSVYGDKHGTYCGFTDTLIPIRTNQEKWLRHSNLPDRIWFRNDLSFLDGRRSYCFNGSPNQKGYCADDLDSAQVLAEWFCTTKIFFEKKYPLWANQFDVWRPNIKNGKEFYALCYSLIFALNKCVVVKFEKDNPVLGAEEINVDNPLSPMNNESFWMKFLDKEVKRTYSDSAFILKKSIVSLYEIFATRYCREGRLICDELKEENYFKYFNYRPFLTKSSGLIQIEKFAKLNQHKDLLDQFAIVKNDISSVKDDLYKLLKKDYKYFG